MRIQCDSCESALAVVICSADEAALCPQCDTRIHAANKLASKHQRVPLINGSSKLPLCDICQEKTAFIFCLEDRALLCRDCDLPLHAPNTLASSHQRFLATGIRVAVADACGKDSFKMEGTPHEPCKQPLRGKWGVSSAVTPPVPLLGGLAGAATKPDMKAGEKQFTGSVKRKNNTHCLPLESAAWRVDEVLNLSDLAGGYNLGDVVSSKADNPSLGGEFDWITDLNLFDEHIYSESFAEVPQLPSTPAATAWPRSGRSNVVVKGKMKDDMNFDSDFEDAFVVPDLGLQSDQLPSPPSKRRRNFIDI